MSLWTKPTATVALCAGVLCKRGVGRPAPAGSRLCTRCRHQLAVGLASLPGDYDECGRLLGGRSQPRDKTSGGPMPGMPFNTAAAEVRAAILGVLASWAGMVAAERSVTGPARTVPALAEFLGRHVDWIAAHAAAAEASEEVAHLVRAARRVAHPSQLRRVPVGSCVEAGCRGELVAIVHPREPLAPAEISCDEDTGHRWSGHEWLQLSRRMALDPSTGTAGPPAIRWLSASSIAQLWRVSAGSVYRLASERRWRRRSSAGRTYYHEDDVEQTFSERRTR